MENKISYQVIKQITNNYEDAKILGRGGFGTVYKGVHEGETIAVKVFDLPKCDSEFQKEFTNLKGLEHGNIVRLLGFCNDIEEIHAEATKEANEIHAEANEKQVIARKQHVALCLEYVQNGHLGRHIREESKELNWHTRYKIIKGVCEGLRYLHVDIDPPLLHLDLKPENILLDKDMIPKVADFGLSRLFGLEKTIKTTSMGGTIGYMPPEYTDLQVISEKYDIYSLGVIMAKIITGEQHFYRNADVPRKEFINQVHDNWKQQLRQYLTSAQLQLYCQQVRRCIELALDCIKKNRRERPTIQEIVSKLMETEKMIGNLAVNIEQVPREVSFPKRDIPERPSSGNNPGAMKREIQESMAATITALPKQLPLDFLTKITHDFSQERKLGEDVFRTVYKGILEDGQAIAVIKFEPDSPFGRDMYFIDKVHNLFVSTKHENIVNIIGYCRESRRILVLSNGRYLTTDIENTLLCHEYFSADLAEYIYGESCRLDWNTSFNMIMGICWGLHYLHTELDISIIHTDLKPENILLDNNMVPKILDFGQSKHYEQILRRKRDAVASIGYMAPEYLYNGELSTQTDIYSLGVMILEIIAGGRNHSIIDQIRSRKFIENVREILTNEYIANTYPSLDACGSDHLRICIEIGLQCVEQDRRKRPSIAEIVSKLNISSKELDNDKMFEVHPRELRFPFDPRKPISCSLKLRNIGDDHVAFMLVSETSERYLTKLPLCGIMPPSCTYTHTITMRKQQQKPFGEFFKLRRVAVGKFDLQDLDKGSIAGKYGDFFDNSKEVQELTLTVNCDPPVQEPTPSTIEIITTKNAHEVSSIDVHPTEPWIMTTSKGSLHFWNYKTMEKLSLLKDDMDEPVQVAKFVEREKWLVAGDKSGVIHVYSYDEDKEVAFVQAHCSCIASLALHPTRPFLLSSSKDDKDHLIKLWEWDENKKWKCTRKFPGHADQVMQVTFNLNNTNTFTSASLDGTVKVWSTDKEDADITLDEKDGSLLCVDNFERDNRQHLIAGCKDGTAQIWNMEIKGCVQSLEGHSGRISAVNVHPELKMLITGSFDGTVRLWKSDTCKTEEIFDFNLGQVYALGFMKDVNRIVVGCQNGIAIMEISTCWSTTQLVADEDNRSEIL